MWFLLVKIFFLLCLAALLGAATAWWWMRRRFVDVTESHIEQTKQLDAFLKQGKAVTRDDVEKSLMTALTTYKPPQPDLLPLQQKLTDIEYAMATPDQDISALHERLHGLEQSVSAISASVASMRTVHLEAIDQHLRGVSSRIDNLRMPDVEGLNSRVSSLTQHVAEARLPDLRNSVEGRLERLERMLTNIKVPETDLGPVHSSLAMLQLAVENLEMPEPDLKPLYQKIDALSVRPEIQRLSGEIDALSSLSRTRDPGIGAMLDRVNAIEAAVREVQIPEPDLTPLMSRLSAIESRVIPAPSADAIVNPVIDRLASMESRIGAMASSDNLVSRLIGIESDLDVISRRTVDLEPIYSQLGALDASLAAIRTELRGQNRSENLERRLTAIQESVLQIPQPDYSRVDLALRSIESNFDLGALEDRLTAIEYGLTAVHHQLRNRGEGPRFDPDLRTRAEPAAIVEPRPGPRTTRPVPPEPAPRPARRNDPIGRARRADDQANLLTHAAFGAGDDLELIVGVGPMLTELLNDVGVFYFWQIAEWSAEDIAYVDNKLLHFRGRIERDDWVGQSRQLAAMPTAARRPVTE
jgi:predicted flap endonuclease-1-like 5' DNA nuclease